MSVRERAPNERDDDFARQAIALARDARQAGNHPFGALLVLNDAAVLTATNTVTTDLDPTAHAETNLVAAAIRCLSPEELALGALHDLQAVRDVHRDDLLGRHSLCVFALSALELSLVAGRDFLIPCRELFDRAADPVDLTGPLLLDEAGEVHVGYWPIAPQDLKHSLRR